MEAGFNPKGRFIKLRATMTAPLHMYIRQSLAFLLIRIRESLLRNSELKALVGFNSTPSHRTTPTISFVRIPT